MLTSFAFQWNNIIVIDILNALRTSFQERCSNMRLTFDISVQDLVRVHVRHTVEQLLHVALDVGIRQGLS